MKPFLLNLFACALLCCAQAAIAATTYRCSSNSFQDTPCLNYSHSKPLKSAEKTVANPELTKAPAPYVVDADCKQRGDAAKKIMWQRQVGKTKEQQLEATQDTPTHALISEVYNQRGTVVEVRNNVELACMQQKEKDKLAAQLLLAANKLKRHDNSTAATPEPTATGKANKN